MNILNDEIHIWCATINAAAEIEQKNFNLLSPDEQLRARKFHFPIHSNRYITARATLRIILGYYLNIKPNKIEFCYDRYLKPAIAGRTDYQFNLAHSEDMAVYGITKVGSIGIDIEKIQPTAPLEIADAFFSDDEKAILENSLESDKQQIFYRMWVRKEAVIKASGKGLSISLSSFSVLPYKMLESVHLDHQTWQVQSVIVPPEYYGALATNQILPKIVYYNFLPAAFICK